MRKIVIVIAIMILTVVTTFCISNADYNTSVSTHKVSKTDFSANTLIAGKFDLATAD